MSKHLTSTVWHTRLDGDGPYQIVRTKDKRELCIAFFPGNEKAGIQLSIPRRDARLLARRINQCLDFTK